MNAPRDIGADIANVVHELREQAWEIAVAEDGQRYRATPPDARANVVFFSMVPKTAIAFQLILRNLRSEGFQWPPPRRMTVEPRHSSAPFAAQPHPDASVGEDRPSPRSAPSSANGAARPTLLPAAPPAAPAHVQISAPPSLDAVFAEVKEARLYAKLARDDRDAIKVEYDAVKSRLDAADAECRRAESALQTSKIKLDRMLAEAP